MLKYVDTMVTFSEVPDEISLCINISNCPVHCKDCHSPYLWKDIGEELTQEVLDSLIKENTGISCVCFMGGDASPKEINELGKYIKRTFPDLKLAWYSGIQERSKEIDPYLFDYLKLGPYIKRKGPLTNPRTNQKFYRKINNGLERPGYDNITYKFWKQKDNEDK